MKSKYFIIGMVLFVATGVKAGDTEKLNNMYKDVPKDIAAKLKKPTLEFNKFSAKIYNATTDSWTLIPSSTSAELTNFLKTLTTKTPVKVEIIYASDAKTSRQDELNVNAENAQKVLQAAFNAGKFMDLLAKYKAKNPFFYSWERTPVVSTVFGFWVSLCKIVPGVPKNLYEPKI